MKRSSIVFALSLSSCLLAACGGESIDPSDESEAVAESEAAIENANALNANAMNANALNANTLYPNALNANALNANALNANALNANALASIKDPGPAGELSRELLQYTVSCALDASQSFSFSWIDGDGDQHDETYGGLLGLATYWATQPLDLTGQRWVSACLASRVNYYGVSVTISSRGDHPSLTEAVAESDELATYGHVEGAFWGNLFSAKPAVYACYNKPNIAHSRSQQRECASGHPIKKNKVDECGIIEIVGDCAKYCDPLWPGQHYSDCKSSPGAHKPTTDEVITVYLK